MKNWSEASLQSVFNHVSQHLIKQGKKAVLKDGGCVCFDEKTKRRCAIGSLLPIREYKCSLTIYEVLSRVGLENCEYTNTQKYILLNDLQICHDCIKPSRWAQRLRVIAKSYGLKVPEFLQTSKGGE